MDKRELSLQLQLRPHWPVSLFGIRPVTLVFEVPPPPLLAIAKDSFFSYRKRSCHLGLPFPPALDRFPPP